MFDLFIQIPGPTFLVLFAGLSAICIFIGWLWVNADGSTQYPLPEPTRFDPLTIAALRGGRNAVIRTAVFTLWNRKLVQFEGEGRNTYIEPTPSDQKPGGEIEAEIYQYVQPRRNSRDLFKDTRFRRRIDKHLEPIYRKLEQSHLVRTRAERHRASTGALVMLLIILIVGGSKLLLGLARGRPVFFLAILLIIAIIAFFMIVKPGARPSRLGRRYLKTVGKQFDWLKETFRRGESPEGIDPAFGIAFFGTGVLAGSTLHAPFSEAFASSSSSIGGGGCGGGCGGGGEGGGGCGDGGCGGCGGE